MKLANLFKKKIKVTTHNGSFHADEVFAIATLSLWAEKKDLVLDITRTRDEAVLNKSDIVLDVGGIYNPEKKRFDHHQKEGAGTHENEVPYASFGLIWKHYAQEICSKEVAKNVERNLVVPVDARDNGISITTPNQLGIIDHRTTNSIHKFNPTITEGFDKTFEQFKKSIEFAKEIIKREIAWENSEIETKKIILNKFEKQGKPEILVLEESLEWEYIVMNIDKIKWVISPDKDSSNWKIKSARENLESYKNRSFFPESWRGLNGKELQDISGIPEAIFCHRGGFFAVAKTKESALEMASEALKN